MSRPSDSNAPDTNRNFDRNVTTEHSYMGEMEELRGCNLYEAGSQVELYAYLSTSLLCPGHILPLINDDANFVAQIKEVFHTSKTFALINLKVDDHNFQSCYPYGVTMAIFEYKEVNGLLFLKARGLQRFRLLTMHISYFNRFGKVRVEILPERTNESILKPIQIRSLNPYRNASVDIRQSYRANGCRRRDACLTAVPYWVFHHFEARAVVEQTLSSVQFLFNINTNTAPKDIIKLSYWYSHNVVFDNEIRLKMLTFDSAISRLRYALSAVHAKNYEICCKICHHVISGTNNFISMSKEGHSTNFCNSNGYVYETVTLTRVYNVKRIGNPTLDFSWFPGYAWTITQCSSCSSHLGWKFTNLTLNPKYFWGIVKSSIYFQLP